MSQKSPGNPNFNGNPPVRFAGPGTKSRGKVLVVDDDALVLRITRARLESAGFEVVLREQALGTSQAVLKEQPDILLLDLSMPTLAGETIAGVVSEWSGLLVIFHSSEDLLSLQEKARRSGVLGAIPKTGDDKLFIAQFERLLARAKHKGAMP